MSRRISARLFFPAPGIDKAAMNRETFKRQYKAADVWITAYKDMYRKYDGEFFDYITKFLVEIGWEELRQKAAKIDALSPEDVERAKQALEKVADRLAELEMMMGKMLKKRIFNG